MILSFLKGLGWRSPKRVPPGPGPRAQGPTRGRALRSCKSKMKNAVKYVVYWYILFVVSISVTKSEFFKENPKMDPPRKCGLISLLPVLGQYRPVWGLLLG